MNELASRRGFLGSLGSASLATFCGPNPHAREQQDLRAERKQLGDLSATDFARQESFWEKVRRAYDPHPAFINLESGFYSAAPRVVFDAMLAHKQRINARNSHYMRGERMAELADVYRALARVAGCAPEALAITRNTTESLNIVIAGMALEAGDEVLHASSEYPSMKQALLQRQLRFGIKVRSFEAPTMPRSHEQVLEAYAAAIGPRTRVLLASHIIYRSGQVLPIQELCTMANERGVRVIVDGAHSFAHLKYSIPELGCTYFGASLHKWLSVPLGAGILWIDPAHVESTWPLMGDVELPRTSMGKFEHYGTVPPATFLAIVDAVLFLESIGRENKEARLRFLKDHWTSAVRGVDRIQLRTPAGSQHSCAIAKVKLEGMSAVELQRRLMDQFGVFTVAIADEGVRVSPNLHNSIADLDRLVEGLSTLAAS